MKSDDDDFTARQEHNILSIVHSDLNAYYNTPLKTKVSMLVQDTLHHTPIIKGIHIVDLDRDIKRCIDRIDTLEAEVSLNKSHLLLLQKQLDILSQEQNGTVLGKVVILKDEE